MFLGFHMSKTSLIMIQVLNKKKNKNMEICDETWLKRQNLFIFDPSQMQDLCRA